jgi:hypothetical protein
LNLNWTLLHFQEKKRIWTISYPSAKFVGSFSSSGAEVPEVITRFNSGKSPSTGKIRKRTVQQDPVKLAKEQFQIAAEAGCDLGLRWLKRLEDYENQEEKLKQIQQWAPFKEFNYFLSLTCIIDQLLLHTDTPFTM